MQATTLSCPSCNAVLRLGRPVDPGKKVRCPKCEVVFPVPDEDAAVHDRSDPPLTGRRRSVVEEDGHPADDYPDRSSVRNRRPADEYDRRAEADDRPLDDEDSPRPRRAARKIKNPVPSGNGVMAGLLIGGVVLLLGVGAIAAWVWPGFLRGGVVPAGTGNEDVLAYVPADSNLIIGLDVGALGKELPVENAQFTKFIKNFQGVPKGLSESLDKADQILIVAKIQAGDGPGLFVIKTREAYSGEELRASFNGSEAQTAHGKPFYRLPFVTRPEAGQGIGPPKTGDRRWLLGMPNNRIILVGDISQSHMEAVLASDGSRPSLSEERKAMVQEHRKGTVWFALDLDPTMKMVADRGFAGIAGTVPGVNNLRAVLPDVKSVSGSFIFGDSVRMAITLAGTNEATAAKVTKVAQGFWDVDGKGFMTLACLGLRTQGAKDIAQALTEATRSLKIETRGTHTSISLGISKAAYDKATTEGQKLFGQQMGGGFGPRPNMGGPPNVRPIRRPLGPPKPPGIR